MQSVNRAWYILRDYYMTFSMSALVLPWDSHIKPDSEAEGLIWVEGWYQGRYGKIHVMIFLSHISHWPFPSITPKRHSVYRSSYAKLHVSNIIVQIDIVWYIFETRLETKILASWTKSTLLRIYFRNFSVQRSFLQYKSQCLEKVNVKYVIKRSW
jgi:hypothetical protein